jgi:hypothetical protein
VKLHRQLMSLAVTASLLLIAAPPALAVGCADLIQEGVTCPQDQSLDSSTSPQAVNATQSSRAHGDVALPRPPDPAATPELGTTALFAMGMLALAAYGLSRLRAAR